jgi:hypothetical protein
MQLFRSKAKETDPGEFWRQTGEKRGGEVDFRTFATFLGVSGERLLALPGLLYRVGEAFWFEDFERDNWLSRILTSKQSFTKTELSFGRADVEFTRIVSRRNAYRCISGAAAAAELRPMSVVARFLSASVTQIGLKDGTSLFFETMLQAEFLAALKSA